MGGRSQIFIPTKKGRGGGYSKHFLAMLKGGGAQNVVVVSRQGSDFVAMSRLGRGGGGARMIGPYMQMDRIDEKYRFLKYLYSILASYGKYNFEVCKYLLLSVLLLQPDRPMIV